MTSGVAPPELAPKIVLGTFAMDQHEVGALTVARILREAGVEVVYLGRFNLPERLITAAVQEDADVIGVSCHSWEYLAYTQDLLDGIERDQLDVAVVLGGSVITSNDAEAVKDMGVTAVLGPSATTQDIVETIYGAARRRRRLTVA